MPGTQRYTAADLEAFPEDRRNRYEILWGELYVTGVPIPRHELVVRRLTFALEKHVEATSAAVFVANEGVVVMSDDTLVRPDILVCPMREITTHWRDVRTVLLAVEVLSPSTSRVDRHLKRKRYMEYGVATYWIVDAEHEQVEVWHPGDEFPAVESDTLPWRPSPDAPELAIDLRALFAGLPR